MRGLLFTFLTLVTITLMGCNQTETIEGTVDEEMTYNDMVLSVQENQTHDNLVDTGDGYNTEVSFGKDNKAVLVHITMDTGEKEISDINFELTTGEENEITSYEALPSEGVQFHEKYNVIDFIENSQGEIDGNLLFAVSNEALKNDEFKLVATFEDVLFTIPITINVEENKTYGLGDTVKIDDMYEINFKKLNVVTESLTYDGSEVVLGNNKVLVLDTEIEPLNGQSVMLQDQNLFFVSSSGDSFMVDSDSYDGYNQLINKNITEKIEGQITLFIPEGIEENDMTFFIETSFSKTDFALKK